MADPEELFPATFLASRLDAFVAAKYLAGAYLLPSPASSKLTVLSVGDSVLLLGHRHVHGPRALHHLVQALNLHCVASCVRAVEIWHSGRTVVCSIWCVGVLIIIF